MTVAPPPGPRAAILVSVESFEEFFGAGFALTPESYAQEYRNDWAWDWCAMLLAQGISPALYVASYEADGTRPTGDQTLVRFLRLSPLYTPWRRLPALRRSPPGRYVDQAINAQAILPGLRRAIKEDGVEVLLVQEYWTGRWDRLAYGLQVPLVAVDQGRPPGREIKILKRRTLPRAKSVITQTDAEAKLVQGYGGRAQRIPNGVDTAFFAPGGGQPDPHAVLLAARLSDRQKRITDLLRAIAQLGAPWHLRIAGAGPEHAALSALAAELGIADRVQWLGFVDRPRLRELYRGCGVFALPSAFEGLPMVLLEAMSCAMACVGSDIPAIAEVIEPGRNGLLTPVGNPDELAETIAVAGAQRERLGAAARQTVLDEYSRQSSGRRLADAIRRAAE